MVVAVPAFDLVDVKLTPPVVRPGTVLKTAAIESLCANQAPLVTLIAPAGYGKTTLLANWAEADSRAFAWVAFDGRDDDDAVVFLRYVASAVHGVEPLPQEAFDALSGPGDFAASTRVPGLGRALGGLKTSLVLVLDDLHRITSRSCLDALDMLFHYLPAGSQIVIASREEPALPLARWRAQGLLYEVGVEDLQLDGSEAALLLDAAGVTVDEEHLTDLTTRTEGWAAGLYLAALSLQVGSASRSPAVGSFTGDDRLVSQYFRDELLSRLPEAEARFLIHSSVLHRMSGELCDAVLERTGSARMLENLERTNRFVVPLDRQRRWYRYHHLFAELLRDELERSEPEVVRELNARAMEWCIAHDDPEAAIRYARAAGDLDTAAGLVGALGVSAYYDGRLATIDGWLSWFSDEEMTRYPALAVIGAWVRGLSGRSADAERWLAIAEDAESVIPLSDGSATITPWVAALRAHMMADGVERALADAEVALEELAVSSVWRPVARLASALAHAMLGSVDEAADHFRTAIKKGLAHGNTDIVYLAHAELALLAVNRGAWTKAGLDARAAQAYVDDAGVGNTYASSALVHVVTARVALHEARHEDARAALVRAHRLRPQLDEFFPWLSIQVGLELTRSHLALADPAAARTVLRETDQILQLRPDMGSLVDDARELHEQVAEASGPGGAWAMSLSRAELRLLPYLATHLTFPEIGERLFVSRHTVKSEAVSIYRKLDTSSRSEAVERAVELGLLESFMPARADFTPDDG